MQKNKTILLSVGIIVIIILIVVFIFSGSKQTNSNEPMSGQNQEATRTTSDGLQITDEVVGTGVEATAGKMVTVQYTGTLTNGTKFDSSFDHGSPFSFLLGVGKVIQGWDEGVQGMKVGGKRKLVIPPSLAYGSREVGGGLIPANSTLVFEVELLDVKDAN